MFFVLCVGKCPTHPVVWNSCAIAPPLGAQRRGLREPGTIDAPGVDRRRLRIAVRQVRHDLEDGSGRLGDLLRMALPDAVPRPRSARLRAAPAIDQGPAVLPEGRLGKSACAMQSRTLPPSEAAEANGRRVPSPGMRRHRRKVRRREHGIPRKRQLDFRGVPPLRLIADVEAIVPGPFMARAKPRHVADPTDRSLRQVEPPPRYRARTMAAQEHLDIRIGPGRRTSLLLVIALHAKHGARLRKSMILPPCVSRSERLERCLRRAGPGPECRRRSPEAGLPSSYPCVSSRSERGTRTPGRGR